MPSLKTKKQKMKKQENTKNVRDKFGASKVWYLFTLVPGQVQPRKKAPKGAPVIMKTIRIKIIMMMMMITEAPHHISNIFHF